FDDPVPGRMRCVVEFADTEESHFGGGAVAVEFRQRLTPKIQGIDDETRVMLAKHLDVSARDFIRFGIGPAWRGLDMQELGHVRLFRLDELQESGSARLTA